MMYQYNGLSRDQFIMGDQFVPDVKYATDVKLECDMESYYSMGVNLASMKFSKDISHMSPFLTLSDAPVSLTNLASTSFVGNPFESSDGECSPKSLDENDLLDSMLGTSPCIKGIKTITQNSKRSGSNKRSNGGCGKIRTSRARKSTESVVPKEKDRARLFNEAFDGLRKRIPSIPASKKLSKIEILRLAICYMSYLKFRLEDVPLTETENVTNESAQETHIGELEERTNTSRPPSNQSETMNGDVIVLTSD